MDGVDEGIQFGEGREKGYFPCVVRSVTQKETFDPEWGPKVDVAGKNWELNPTMDGFMGCVIYEYGYQGSGKKLRPCRAQQTFIKQRLQNHIIGRFALLPLPAEEKVYG